MKNSKSRIPLFLYALAKYKLPLNDVISLVEDLDFRRVPDKSEGLYVECEHLAELLLINNTDDVIK